MALLGPREFSPSLDRDSDAAISVSLFDAVGEGALGANWEEIEMDVVNIRNPAYSRAEGRCELRVGSLVPLRESGGGRDLLHR